MRMSEEQLKAHLETHQNRKKGALQPTKSEVGARALGRQKQGVMNNTEKNYAGYLESRKIRGEIVWYKFDCINLRLAEKTFYKPDFFVLTKDMELEVHEVKGFMTDDALVKIKVAASIFPFKFIVVRYKDERWNFTDY